jgi:hypothetical protein
MCGAMSDVIGLLVVVLVVYSRSCFYAIAQERSVRVTTSADVLVLTRADLWEVCSNLFTWYQLCQLWFVALGPSVGVNRICTTVNSVVCRSQIAAAYPDWHQSLLNLWQQQHQQPLSLMAHTRSQPAESVEDQSEHATAGGFDFSTSGTFERK